MISTYLKVATVTGVLFRKMKKKWITPIGTNT